MKRSQINEQCRPKAASLNQGGSLSDAQALGGTAVFDGLFLAPVFAFAGDDRTHINGSRPYCNEAPLGYGGRAAKVKRDNPFRNATRQIHGNALALRIDHEPGNFVSVSFKVSLAQQTKGLQRSRLLRPAQRMPAERKEDCPPPGARLNQKRLRALLADYCARGKIQTCQPRPSFKRRCKAPRTS